MLPELKFVNLIGVELEGGWNRTFSDIQIGHDISVTRPKVSTSRGCSCGESHSAEVTCHWGEIPSPPMTLKDILEWMRVHYMDGVHPSCGFHIHVSVKHALHYSQLVDKRFYDLFLKEVRKWGHSEGFPSDHAFWERLDNKDTKQGFARFSNHPYAAARQIVMTEKQDFRRSALNYCYAQHGTLECRIFPAFSDVKIAARAVIFFVKLIEEWLASRPEEKGHLITVKKIKDLTEIRSAFKPLRG